MQSNLITSPAVPLSIPSVIAIDGPVATGKTVVGRLLAQRLGYKFLDTGTMYRAITWLAMKQGIDLEDEESLVKLALNSNIQASDKESGVIISVTPATLEEHRTEIDKKISLVSKVQGVREALVKQQQMLAAEGGIVVAGRDIGTVVTPNAPVKLYFQASSRERAKRRHQELCSMGRPMEFAQVLEDLEARDKLDSERAHSPMHPADDAHVIDSEGMTIDDVVQRALELIEKA